jgi:hypothetical protein
MAEYSGGSKPHLLYGVWIDDALKSNGEPPHCQSFIFCSN